MMRRWLVTRDEVIARLAAAFGPHRAWDRDLGALAPDGDDASGTTTVLEVAGDGHKSFRALTYGEIADALTGTDLREPGKMSGHEYLSTACLHAAGPGQEHLHGYCQSPEGRADGGETWAKTPSACKFCGTPCQCPCHREPAS